MPKAPKNNTKVNWPPPAADMHPAPRPTSVTIGHMEFAIHWIPQEEWTVPNGNDPSLQGIFLANQGRINILVQPDVHEQTLRETLWHEILHGCWWWTGMAANSPVALSKGDDELEEDVVMRLTHASLFVIQENPEVMAYITANLYRKKVKA